MTKNEYASISFLCELFNWPEDDEHMFSALVVLRRHRGEAIPTWDDFRYNKDRV